MLTSKDKKTMGCLGLLVLPMILMSMFAGGGPAEFGGDPYGDVAPIKSSR